LEYRLKSAGWTYEKIVIKKMDRLDRAFRTQLVTMLEDRRNQRVLVYVDRRNPAHVVSEEECQQYIIDGYGRLEVRDDEKVKRTWLDTVYFVQVPKERFRVLPEGNTPETSFWASAQCMFPRVKEDAMEQNDAAVADGAVGCTRAVNGFQFTVSWQAEHEDCVRHYLFTGGKGMRFFPRDVDKLWPRHFKQDSDGQLRELNENTRKKLKGMRQVHDEEFAYFYKKSTRRELVAV